MKNLYRKRCEQTWTPYSDLLYWLGKHGIISKHRFN